MLRQWGHTAEGYRALQFSWRRNLSNHVTWKLHWIFLDLIKISFTASFNRFIEDANIFKHFLQIWGSLIHSELKSAVFVWKFSTVLVELPDCSFLCIYKLCILNWLQSTNSLAHTHTKSDFKQGLPCMANWDSLVRKITLSSRTH